MRTDVSLYRATEITTTRQHTHTHTHTHTHDKMGIVPLFSFCSLPKLRAYRVRAGEILHHRSPVKTLPPHELMSVEKTMQKNEDFTRAMMQAMEERTEKAEERAEKAEDGGKQMRFQERAEAQMKRVKEDEAESLKRVKEDEAESDQRQKAKDTEDDFNR